MTPARPRLALALLTAGLVLVLSYTVQRMASLGGGISPTEATAVQHIPYYWRCGLALLHALVAGALVLPLLSSDRATAVLSRASLPAALLVAACAALMAVFP